MPNLRPKLSICNVTRRFSSGSGHVDALQNVSLDVADNEFLMVVGPSGCGKSTLLNIVAGLDRADEGHVLLDGQEVTEPGPDRSLVFQDGALFPWLSAVGNVEFGLREKGMRKAARRDTSMHYLSMVGLSGFEDHFVHQLSGGMRQRVAIARSLVLEPAVLLMDEPFSALDALTREELYGQLQGLRQGLRCTVVFVTHNVREAVTLGDRVVVMSPRPGRICEQFEVSLNRPRQIDDLAVAERAHQISAALRAATADCRSIDTSPEVVSGPVA